MAKVTIESGNPKLRGSYDLDTSYFTNRELHLIKREAGIRAGELEDAFQAGDNDLSVVIAYIALQRNGKLDIPVDALWDMEVGKITLGFTDEEQEPDAVPPQNEPAARSSPDSSSAGSFNGSETSSEESPESTPLSGIGAPGSDS